MGKKRYDRNRTVREQLKGKECEHKNVVTCVNSKGQEFNECGSCGAFLGFV